MKKSFKHYSIYTLLLIALSYLTCLMSASDDNHDTIVNLPLVLTLAYLILVLPALFLFSRYIAKFSNSLQSLESSSSWRLFKVLFWTLSIGFMIVSPFIEIDYDQPFWGMGILLALLIMPFYLVCKRLAVYIGGYNK